MKKTTKIVLGSILIASAVGLYIYNNKKADNTADVCLNNQKRCPNGKCYDPTLRYESDPCGASSDINVPIKTEILTTK